MSHSTAPAFQFYPKDFLSDGNVAEMTLQERGAYITLLCICWQEGSIPSDHRRLARILGVSLTALGKFWPALERCFVSKGDAYVHKRLEREREKQDQFRRRQSDNGSQGAAKRWHRHAKPIAQPVPKHDSSVSDLQSPISKDDPKEQDRRRGRGQPPMALGLRKLKVWRWMLDDWTERLGEHVQSFDLHQWLVDFDAQLQGVPPSQPWEFLDAEFMAEVRRRGLAVSTSQLGKQTNAIMNAVNSL